MKKKPFIKKWPDGRVHGSKRTNIRKSYHLSDWFVGFGKDESCQFEGSWWDMICFARNVLSSENTKLAAPELYHPEMRNTHYAGPYPYAMLEEVEALSPDGAGEK